MNHRTSHVLQQLLFANGNTDNTRFIKGKCKLGTPQRLTREEMEHPEKTPRAVLRTRTKS